MHRSLTALTALLVLCCGGAIAAETRRPSAAAIQTWQARKFGLFIHFGLYSTLGGVWNGGPVKQGYSEQIMRNAPISREQYAALAAGFVPNNWDPDQIAELAKAAGMKFIVITAKHHDGFNMFHTRLSNFNIVDATPYHRDVVKSLADACRRHGLSFGVYYSSIDWHDERATPPSQPPTPENDNPIPPAHEEFNVAQLKELVSNYGPLSEIWFDMGQPTPEQSKRFAATVHAIQPDCMVSGRVFNSQGDFTVMGDNALPDSVIDEPWQTPASIYDETWGYRSWQERRDLSGKTNEHILRLVKVASRGGNYLLNIGPRGDGSVVPFEADVLRGMGRWITANAEAVYDTQPQPFRELDFGHATVKPGKLYLFVTKWPADGRLRLPGFHNRITGAHFLADRSKPLSFSNDARAKSIDISGGSHTPPVTVVAVEFAGALDVAPPSIAPEASGAIVLPAARATRYFNYNGRGYADPPTVYKLRWDFAPAGKKYRVEITYGKSAAPAPVEVAIGKEKFRIELPTAAADAARSVVIGTVQLPAAESMPLIVTPRRPFVKGDKLAAEVDQVTLTPVR
ncbi:MAG TPA: alpha-L-fucosidase [Bryobacteraceae bacterium]|nr:alpha-L-fucosidase [Bryobacteraceae bacterium]